MAAKKPSKKQAPSLRTVPKYSWIYLAIVVAFIIAAGGFVLFHASTQKVAYIPPGGCLGFVNRHVAERDLPNGSRFWINNEEQINYCYYSQPTGVWEVESDIWLAPYTPSGEIWISVVTAEYSNFNGSTLNTSGFFTPSTGSAGRWIRGLTVEHSGRCAEASAFWNSNDNRTHIPQFYTATYCDLRI